MPGPAATAMRTFRGASSRLTSTHVTEAPRLAGRLHRRPPRAPRAGPYPHVIPSEAAARMRLRFPARLARNPPGSLTPELASTASAFFGWGRQRGLGRSGQFHGGFREPRIPVPPRLADVGSRPPPFARDREHPDVVERVERSETAGRPMDPRAARGGCGRSEGRVPEGSGGASLPREPRRESSGAVAAAGGP